MGSVLRKFVSIVLPIILIIVSLNVWAKPAQVEASCTGVYSCCETIVAHYHCSDTLLSCNPDVDLWQ